jgi:hypothetical protein
MKINSSLRMAKWLKTKRDIVRILWYQHLLLSCFKAFVYD